ncbi:unnamed protein product, partial [Iphiclides podalirius]
MKFIVVLLALVAVATAVGTRGRPVSLQQSGPVPIRQSSSSYCNSGYDCVAACNNSCSGPDYAMCVSNVCYCGI